MKIYATSDLHGNLEGINPTGCDVCVIAGDLDYHGFDDPDRHRIFIEGTVCGFATAFPTVKFVLVAGNHDLFRPDNIKWPSNVICLRDSGCTINGVRFWGTSLVYAWRKGCRWANATSSGAHARFMWSHIPVGTDVLVTHMPPYIPDSSVDWSCKGQEHDGSRILAEEIKRAKVRCVICGHVHEGEHCKQMLGNTAVFNVSRCDNNHNVTYAPLVIDLA